MQRITWYRLFAMGVLAAPIWSGAQGPQPKLKQIASLPGVLIDEAILMPNGRVILYTVDVDTTRAIFAYDLASKRSTLVTNQCSSGDLSVSPAGDRIAFEHVAEDRQPYFVATMPINPATGMAAGPWQRLGAGTGHSGAPNFSPDGRLIAYNSAVGDQNVLAVVPAVGGPERVLSRGASSPKAWSADGKWIFVEVDGVNQARSIARVPAQGGPAETLFSYSGRVASIGPDIAFYMDKGSRTNAISRMSYITRSGARGEFSVPPGSQRARYVSLESGAKWLLIQSVRSGSGPSTSTIYELDVSPILQATQKR